MWSKDYFLLMQGQAVSCLGSTLYSVVASLWAYDLTGSAMIMSIVYSAANIARLAAFPFAGVIADRFSRRNLIVVCDIVCGASMLIVAAMALTGSSFAVWGLVFHSAVSGAISGVFNPSVNAMMLSITKKENYVRANSVYNAVEYGIDMIGQGIAGTFYMLLGAPMLFLINGLTFLFSAFTEGFIQKDPAPMQREKKPFWRDAMEGVRYILVNGGIRLNLLLAFCINFAFGILRVALVPWMLSFGTEYYGLLGTFRSAGVVIGTLLLTVRNIPENKRYNIYFWCQTVFVLCIAASTLPNTFLPAAALFCVAYANQSVFNSVQRSAVIITAPNEIRGKVLCAVQALAMGFSAVGNLSGGVLCKWIAPRPLVFAVMSLLLVGILWLGRKQSVKELF